MRAAPSCLLLTASADLVIIPPQTPEPPPALDPFITDVNLFEEQLPPDTLVVLSGRDALMAASQARGWCRRLA